MIRKNQHPLRNTFILNKMFVSRETIYVFIEIYAWNPFVWVHRAARFGFGSAGINWKMPPPPSPRDRMMHYQTESFVADPIP